MMQGDLESTASSEDPDGNPSFAYAVEKTHIGPGVVSGSNQTSGLDARKNSVESLKVLHLRSANIGTSRPLMHELMLGTNWRPC